MWCIPLGPKQHGSTVSGGHLSSLAMRYACICMHRVSRPGRSFPAPFTGMREKCDAPLVASSTARVLPRKAWLRKKAATAVSLAIARGRVRVCKDAGSKAEHALPLTWMPAAAAGSSQFLSPLSNAFVTLQSFPTDRWLAIG